MARSPFWAGAQAHETFGATIIILVVFELSGSNDGLNTLVPYTDDAYYKLRPNIGIKASKLRRIDDRWGFSPGMAGFERLYKQGNVAVVHGCGYEGPSFSHFTSMAYWHTAAPNSGEEYGWVGRLADAMKPGGAPNYLVNIDETQSLAVRSREHTPVVFDDPEKFVRKGFYQERPLFEHVADAEATRAMRNVTCWRSRAALRTPPRWYATRGLATRHRSTTASSI
jgi:uncharacterized protein (DUF1501 family)